VISKIQVDDLIAYLRAGLPRVPMAEAQPVPGNQGAAVEGAPLTAATGASTVTAPTASGVFPTRARPPHDGGIIPEDQLRALVAYLKTLA
jgi:hypothetical protein